MPDPLTTFEGLPPLHCLVAFEAVARLGSAAKAARELGVSRSALSHSIVLLEHRLKVRLFTRYSPSAQLTRAGEVYYAAVLNFVRTIGDGLYGLTGQAHVPLRLSVSPGMSRLWLSRRLSRFRERYPRIDLMISVTESLADVPGHQFDIAIRYGGDDEPGTTALVLWNEAIGAVARPAIARQAGAADVQTVAREFTLIEHVTWPWDEWLGAQGFAGEAPAPALVCRDLPLLLEAAAEGHGIALAPMKLVREYLAAGRLGQASPTLLVGRPYRAVAATDSLGRPAVAAFLQWLREEAAG